MTMETGRMLLHYRLVDKIGEGGMGVVWKAIDTTLDREVAIKILPDQFAADRERLARFEREARLLASLNHPHIAGIYGIHEAPAAGPGESGIRFLAMELVSGEELAVALQSGPIPQDRVLQIMSQVAEALEAAHESGVIHRDLKPANVRLTTEGNAKVLDFGLAKAYDPNTASDPVHSPTMTSAGTVAGLILGTAAYMSPEQASGQATDRRADIWSFGVMLHELLSGKRLFEGETISHTLADVLRAPIELDDLPASVPSSIRRLVERCLDRDKMRRLRDIGEARIVLEDEIAHPGSGDAPGAQPGIAPARSRLSSLLPWVLAGLATVVAILAFLLGQDNTTGAIEPARRFTIEARSGNSRQGDGRAVAISSDGRHIVSPGVAGAEDVLYLRAINDFEQRPIEGSQGGRRPTFSPDNQWIAFLDSTSLRKVRVSGGPSIEIGQAAASAESLHWGTDNFIYYGAQAGLWRINTEGGEPEALVAGTPADTMRTTMPFLLPGGRYLLCNRSAGRRGTGQLLILDLETKEVRKLEMQGSNARYLPTGHLLFAQSNSVFVAPFDLDELKLTGAPMPVLPRAWVDQGQIQADVSADGTVVYLPAAREETQALVTVGLDGQVAPLVPDGLSFISLNDPRFSRDGRSVLISVEGGAIWMVDLDTQTPTLLSEDGFYPLWSPDGSEVVFGSTRNVSYDLYRRPVDLSRPEELLLDWDNNLRSADWTWQGGLIVREEVPGKGMDLHYWPDINDESTLVTLMDGEDDELAPVVSRDGKWLAYVSGYSGDDAVYVTTFPEAGARMKISNHGGNSPTWAPDGKHLYYFEGPSLIAVTIETEPRFRVLKREPLLEGNYVQYRWARQYDIHPDGKRFVMIKNPPRGNIEVITRWFSELPDP
ncbi:MAG: serine/threonine-protein kinase [Acidobacteria bacterium]|uniref:Serine/threonine-protein kinase n=1 Tax=Candidatus Polarisedimenticola svalbardensis TaxID=2886004 RepID=A0A8J6Y1B6_9BACT|nr:serine/threonine-protein kinase [Candidatus Polarisedimenticola svalbardensis]